MAKRIVRLTERELISLVKRVVKEQAMGAKTMPGSKQSQMGGEMEEGFFGDKFGWVKDVAREVAGLFKSEVLSEIPEDELEDLKRQASNIDAKGALSNLADFAGSEEGKEALEKAEEHISPDVLTESIIYEGLSDRTVRILAKTGVLSGLGLTASGFLGFASNAMGYIDSSFLTQVNEIISPYCGIFCGPLSVLVIILGALLALRSAMIGYDRRKK
jgi:hypothetical protein